MSKCDHIIGFEEHPDRDIGLTERRESKRSGTSNWLLVFAFCPICGTRIATDEECSYEKLEKAKNNTGGAPI